jgi:pullulanase
VARHRAVFRIIVALALCAAASCSRIPTGPNDVAWRILPGHVERLSFMPFREGRQCWVYLPPGYATASRSYPVLYLNDGEVAFDANDGMHVNRICEDLIRRGEIEPIIVVAIENGPGPQRFIDYTPWTAPYWQPNGGGDFYLRAISDTLKPEIDRRYRTLSDPENTAIAGMSLGGLISVYAGYAYDSTFGKVAGFSPTYGYGFPGMEGYAQSVGRPPGLRLFYQDTGYPDDNYIGSMERIALDQGFTLGMDFMSVTVEGAEHRGGAWERRFPAMLRFLFRRQDE